MKTKKSGMTAAEARRAAKRDLKRIEREIQDPEGEIRFSFAEMQELLGGDIGKIIDKASFKEGLKKNNPELADKIDAAFSREDRNSSVLPFPKRNAEPIDPYEEEDDDEEDDSVSGLVGGVIGAVLGGIGGLVLGGVLGSALGKNDEDEDDDEEEDDIEDEDEDDEEDDIEDEDEDDDEDDDEDEDDDDDADEEDEAEEDDDSDDEEDT